MGRTEEIRGCGNHLCKVRKPKGQGTNSCCSCFPHVGGRLDLEAAQLLERVLRHRLEALARVERLEEGYRDIWRCDLCEPCRDVIRCVADEQFKEALEDSDEQD